MLLRRSVYVRCRAPVLPRCILAYDVQHDRDRCTTKDKAPSAMSSFGRGTLSNCVLDIFGDIFAIPFLCTIVPPSILRCIGITTAGRPNRACPQPMLTRYRRRWEARARRRNDLQGGSSARLLHRRPMDGPLIHFIVSDLLLAIAVRYACVTESPPSYPYLRP